MFWNLDFAMQSNFLQSKDWVDFQRRVGREVFTYEKGLVQADIIKHGLPLGQNYLYVPYGPVLTDDSIEKETQIKNDLDKFIKDIRELAKQEKSIFVKIEPQSDFIAKKLAEKKIKISDKNLQPHKTQVIDLAYELEELLKDMHHKTRYNIGLAQKKNVEIREIAPEDFDNVWRFYNETAKRNKFYLHPKSYYLKLVDFRGEELSFRQFGAFAQNKLLSTGIFGFYKDTVYYLHGASSVELKEYMGPYALHWRIICDAKEKGFKYYDFWGIDPVNWPGVTRFKLGFGGRTVEYPGAFDKPNRYLWWLIYKLVRRIF